MHEVILSNQAQKKLKKLRISDLKTAKRIQLAIKQVQTGEKPGESLKGQTDYKKTRIGKYRIITKLNEETLLVFIIEKRDNVYQTFQHLL